MRDREAPRFMKLQKFKLPDERSKILFGVAVHFAILSREIDLATAWSTFQGLLNRFLEQQLNHYLNCPYESFTQIANGFGLNINLWKFHHGAQFCPQPRNPHLERKIHANYNAYGSIHFIVNDGVIESVILKPNDYGLNRELTINFKQALSIHNEITLDEVNLKWPENQLKFPRADIKLNSIFGHGLELWTRKSKKCSKQVIDNVPTLVFKSRFKSHLKLMVDTWPDENPIIDINDQFTLTTMNLYQCPKDYCLYATSNRFRFDKHCTSCSDETIVDFEQRNLLDDDIVGWMIEEKFLSERPKIDSKHAHYDIETILRPLHSLSGKTECFGEERIISIGVSDNISGQTRSKVFAREHLDEESLVKMVDEFWMYLLVLREDFRKSLPPEVNSAFFKIQSMLWPKEKDVFGQTIKPPLSDPLQIKLKAAFHYLDGIRSFKVVGWNSENFGTDLNLFMHIYEKLVVEKICFKILKRFEDIITGIIEII